MVLPIAFVGVVLAKLIVAATLDYIPFSDWAVLQPYMGYASGVMECVFCPFSFVCAGSNMAPSSRILTAIALALTYMIGVVAVSLSTGYIVGYRVVGLILCGASSLWGVMEVRRESGEDEETGASVRADYE
jgi:hypothetical protein